MKFPTEHLLPKHETKAKHFLQQYPQYDGRNVRIGILDTGIDPAISLLTSLPPSSGVNEKRCKLIHVVDCTGSGDVEMTKTVDAILQPVDTTTNTDSLKEKEDTAWVIENDLFGRKVFLNKDLKLCPFPNPSPKNDDDGQSKNNDKDTKTVTTNTNINTKNPIKMPIRLGFKRGYDLYPKGLLKRVQRHYSEQFQQCQNYHIKDIYIQLNKWNQEFSTKTPTTLDLLRKEDLEFKLQLLQSCNGNGGGNANNNNGIPKSDPLLSDPGPVYQIISFYDGKDYRVIIHPYYHDFFHSNTVDDEDLSNRNDNTPPHLNSNDDITDLTHITHPFTDYHKEQQVGTFSSLDMLNYAINIYENGSIVSIVVDAGAHASHVAGIAASYDPSVDNNNTHSSDDTIDNHHDEKVHGVAPGAQLISLKIGDSRLGSMETGSALVRALIEAIRWKCDVINLSYGEGCSLPNTGRFIELVESFVYKYGIIFVSSAGNNGPALTTVGAPGGTTEAVIGVGAYVSNQMMEAEYSMRVDPDKSLDKDTLSNGTSSESTNQNLPSGTNFTWSSVGPTSDGSIGVDIIAPGAAITCVPHWCLQRNQLMNGTSMSSPNATGCVALLLSAAKAEGISLTPSRLKRALVNSAKPMNGLTCLQQGWGMIQVDKAWDFIKARKDDIYEDVAFKINIVNISGRPRGVYLRQPEETKARKTFNVEVNPQFSTPDNVNVALQERRINFEMKFTLKSDSEWVDCPNFFFLTHAGRGFKFDVDPTLLNPGVHTAKILAFDSDDMNAGHRFHIPITVIKHINHEDEVNISMGDMEFSPGEVKRYFLNAPKGATWMDVTLKDLRNNTVDTDSSSRLVVLHTVQLLPNKAYRDAEEQKYFNLVPSQETVTSIPVHGGITCEMALARYWSCAGGTKINASIKFRGARPIPESLTLRSGGGDSQVLLYSDLRDEYVLPSAKLDTWNSPLVPSSDGVISPCYDRDIWPDNKRQIYQLVLTYNFEQEEAGSIVPRAPILQGYLYESSLESQLMMIFDKHKLYLGVADSWPKEVKVPKGNVVIRLQIRHDKVELLEKFKNMTIWIDRKLSNDVSLSSFSSHADMVVGEKKFGKRMLLKGTCASVFFSEPTPSALPKGSKCGDILSGSVSYVNQGANLPGLGKKPGGFKISYVIGVKSDKKDNDNAKAPESPDVRSIEQKIEESIKSAKVDQLMKYSSSDKDEEVFDKMFSMLKADHPTYLPLLVAGLKYFDKEEKRIDRLPKVIDAADEIISLIDEDALACHFGTTIDKDDVASMKTRKDMEEKKSQLVEALTRKARALADIENKRLPSHSSAKFDDAIKHIEKWEKIETNNKFAILCLEKYRRAELFGLSLKLLSTLLLKDGDDTKGGIKHFDRKELLELRRETLHSLNYSHLSQRDDIWNILSSPKNYALF